jgi:hypothetical protein
MKFAVALGTSYREYDLELMEARKVTLNVKEMAATWHLSFVCGGEIRVFGGLICQVPARSRGLDRLSLREKRIDKATSLGFHP